MRARLTTPRAVPLIATIAFSALATAVVLHVALRASATQGPLTAAEVETHAWIRGRALRLDAASARRTRDGTVWLTLPEGWTGDRGPDRAPRLGVFVDGRRLRFERRAPEADDADAVAYYVPIDRRRVELAIPCPALPSCGTVVALREDVETRTLLALSRLASRPAWSVLALVGVACCALAGALSARRAQGRELTAAAVVGAVPLAAWALRPGAGPARADAWLAAATLALCAPLLRLWVADARAGWGRRALDGLERAAAALGRPFASPRGERWTMALAVAAAVLLFLPLAVRGRTFFIDWANHLYCAARQADGLREVHHPTYFLHSTRSGPFYPYFAFYGGSLYVLTATLGVAIGSVGAAYVAMLALGFAMALGGTAWLAHQSGLARGPAAMVGLVVVSSAYYLTNAYGRGSWAELIATSAVALLAAAVSSVLWSARRRRRDALALLLAGAIFFGSHTITLVWGSVFLALLLLATWAARRAAGLGLPPARVAVAGAVLALALGANAWFLAPALAYGRATYIGGYAARGFASDTQFLNVPAVVLHPGRTVPPQSSTPGLYTQVSIYVLVWALAAAVVLHRREQPASVRRAWPGLLALLVLLSWLIAAGRLDLPWTALPRVLKIVQFQFRLHTYVTYTLAALVAVALLAARRARRPALWTATLVAALAVQFGLGQWQAWTARTYFPISEITRAGPDSPPTHVEAGDYRFVEHPDVHPLGETVFTTPLPALALDVHAVHADRLELTLPGPDPIQTSIVYSPLIEGTGDVMVAGRTADGSAVLRSRATGSGPHTGAIVAARPLPVVVGVTTSILSLLGAAFLVAALGRARVSGA